MRYSELLETLNPTPENIEAAKEFVLRKWKDRAKERGSAEPVDLSYSCKFSSMFAQKIFGGKIQGSYDHQYVVKDGQVIDLNLDAADVKALSNPHKHDPLFFGNRDHKISMKSCEPRVNQWVDEFLSQPLTESIKPSLAPAILYQGMLFRGEKGQAHVQIAHEYGMPHMASDGERGFVNGEGTFFNREDALQYAKDNHLVDPNTKATQLMSDALTEAPISDVSYRHEVPDEKFGHGTAFDALDAKLVQSKPHIARIVKAFTKTPHTFKLVFMDNDRIDGEGSDNADPDQWARDMNAGIHKEYMGVKGTPGIITMVHVSNLAPETNKMPLTPWTVAHKIGHVFQDSMDNGEARAAPIKEIMYSIYKQMAFIAADGDAEEQRAIVRHYQDRPNSIYAFIFDTQLMLSKLTMKSARTDGQKGINGNAFEIFAELIAQYLIQGKVTMVEMQDYSLVDGLNELFNQLFKACYGYVFSEV